MPGFVLNVSEKKVEIPLDPNSMEYMSQRKKVLDQS